MSDDKFWVEELYDAPQTLTLPTELLNLVHTLVMHQACDMDVPLSAYEDLVNQLGALRLAATPPPQGGFFAEDPDDYEDEPDTCTNHYACLCGEDWQIEATSEHNDRCPKCNKEIEPYYSDSYDDPEPRGKEITAAYNALPHRKETT